MDFSEIRTQYKELSATNVVEEILSMEEVTKTLLLKFLIATGKKPHRIIFYRQVFKVKFSKHFIHLVST